MSKVTTTLKLKFHDPNKVKSELFAQMTDECTSLANKLLKVPMAQRRQLTTAKMVANLSSALANQVIRNTTPKAALKIKKYRLVLPEANKQNWKVANNGDPYSVSFPTIKGVKRVLLEVTNPHHKDLLDRLIAADVVMEDLCGCLGTMPQSKKQRSDAGNNRHRWAFYDLQQKTAYKLELVGRKLILRPAPYTSKSDSRNGVPGKRDGHQFTGFDGYRVNADWNAARNLAKWDGFACPLGLYVSGYGVFDSPQNFGFSLASGHAEMQRDNSLNTQELNAAVG